MQEQRSLARPPRNVLNRLVEAERVDTERTVEPHDVVFAEVVDFFEHLGRERALAVADDVVRLLGVSGSREGCHGRDAQLAPRAGQGDGLRFRGDVEDFLLEGPC